MPIKNINHKKISTTENFHATLLDVYGNFIYFLDNISSKQTTVFPQKKTHNFAGMGKSLFIKTIKRDIVTIAFFCDNGMTTL